MLAPSGGQKRRSPIKAISRWWRDWASGRAALSDLKCCGEIEVDRIAKDVGISASELRRLVSRGPEEADLLLLRMAALGLDRNEVSRTEPRTFQDLQRVCSMCESHRRCARDLARDSANPRWEDYCPNAVTLMALNAILANAKHTKNVPGRKTDVKTARIWQSGR
jgi:hypothetical protein